MQETKVRLVPLRWQKSHPSSIGPVTAYHKLCKGINYFDVFHMRISRKCLIALNGCHHQSKRHPLPWGGDLKNAVQKSTHQHQNLVTIKIWGILRDEVDSPRGHEGATDFAVCLQPWSDNSAWWHNLCFGECRMLTKSTRGMSLNNMQFKVRWKMEHLICAYAAWNELHYKVQ